MTIDNKNNTDIEGLINIHIFEYYMLRHRIKLK